MEKNEIKKILYKEKPVASATRSISRTELGESAQEYIADTSIGPVRFLVPFSEKPETGFKSEESAQLLIRWIV